MIDVMSIESLSILWISAKEEEKEATKKRREIEDRLLSLIGIPENLEGTENAECEDFKIKITGRMNRKVNAEVLQEIAAENGLTSYLSDLFNWKPSVNMTAWKTTQKDITDILSEAITTKPGRASFKIERKVKNDKTESNIQR